MSGDSGAQSLRLERFISIGMLVLLAALTVAHPSATRIHAWPWRGVVLALWLGPCLLLLHHLLCTGRSPRLPGFLLAGLLLLAGTTVASAWLSPFQSLSLPHVWPTLSGAALAVWLHASLVRAPASIERAAALLAAIAAGFVFASLVLWWWTSPPPRWLTRNDAPFGHSNYTAGALVLLLPWLGWATGHARRGAKIAWGIAALAGLVALITTGSRGGVIAFAATVGLVVLWIVVRADWPRSRKLLLLAAALGVAAAAVLANPRLRDLALGRGWSDAARESNTQRSAMLAGGVKLGEQRPLVGWGPGTVPLAYPMIRAELHGGVDNVLQLHNTPVQVWATLGAGGVLAIAMVGFPVLRRARIAATRSTGAAAACSLAGYAVFALTDHQLDLPLINWMAAANVALLFASGGEPRQTWAPRSARLGALLVAALVLVPALPTARDLLGRRAYAANQMDRAIAWMPEDAYYYHRLATDLLAARRQTADASKREHLAGQAIQLLRQSLETEAHTEFAYFNLGWLLLDRDPVEAGAAFRAAASLAPTRGGVYFGLGLAERAQGRRSASIRAFALEALNDPRALTAPIWETADFAPLRDEVIREMDTLAKSTSPASPRVSSHVAWSEWWASRDRPDNPPAGFSPASRAFVAAAPSVRAAQPLPGGVTFTWERLYDNWRRNDWTSFSTDPAFASALERRTRRHRTDFYAFLRAGSEDDPALIRTTLRVRPGSGVLAYHPDGPPLVDAYVVQENRLHAILSTELFPPKGALPGALLLSWLPGAAMNESDRP